MARRRAGQQRDGVDTKRNGGATTGHEAELWAMADALRGSMDAAEYKHVVLGLIFLKYISDAFEERQAAVLAEFGEDAAEDRDEYTLYLAHKISRSMKYSPASYWSLRALSASSCRAFCSNAGKAACSSSSRSFTPDRRSPVVIVGVSKYTGGSSITHRLLRVCGIGGVESLPSLHAILSRGGSGCPGASNGGWRIGVARQAFRGAIPVR